MSAGQAMDESPDLCCLTHHPIGDGVLDISRSASDEPLSSGVARRTVDQREVVSDICGTRRTMSYDDIGLDRHHFEGTCDVNPSISTRGKSLVTR